MDAKHIEALRRVGGQELADCVLSSISNDGTWLPPAPPGTVALSDPDIPMDIVAWGDNGTIISHDGGYTWEQHWPPEPCAGDDTMPGPWICEYCGSLNPDEALYCGEIGPAHCGAPRPVT